MRYYLRRNKFRIIGMIALVIIALIVFIPAPQANLGPTPIYSSITVCQETVRQAEIVYKENGFVFVTALDIMGNDYLDRISTFISRDYPLISHLTSKEGCVIDATVIDFGEAL